MIKSSSGVGLRGAATDLEKVGIPSIFGDAKVIIALVLSPQIRGMIICYGWKSLRTLLVG